MRRIAIAACATALLIAGCGGGGDESSTELPESDQTQIQLVTDQLISAAKAKDGQRICGILQPSLIDKAFGSQAKCAKRLVGRIRANSILSRLEIDSYEATETGAKVTFKQNPPGEVVFVKENDAWYIDLTSLVSGGTGSDSSAGQ